MSAFHRVVNIENPPNPPFTKEGEYTLEFSFNIVELRFTFYVLDMKFEEALKKLEESVEQLETGDLPLEKALEVFENGIKMSRLCTKKLEEAEQKVELLLGVSHGEPQTTLFDLNTIEE